MTQLRDNLGLVLLQFSSTWYRHPKMDELKWDAIRNGDLETLKSVVLSSSTARRARALQSIREKNGKALTPNLTLILAY